ncbi:MAG: hypothetical protein MI923_28525 [Phycisphaerales bacterium]|nr:hypothetical protein [Phycisphaerales bacterium]
MRGLVVVGVVIVLGSIVTLLMMKKMNEDPGLPIAVAFGKPSDDGVEVHVVITLGMKNTEYARVDMDTGTEYWDEWVEEHFELTGESGGPVKFSRTNFSELITAQKAGALFEFFIKGKVQGGENYTFDYIPKRAESRRYRYTFTAPTNSKKMKRYTFELAK